MGKRRAIRALEDLRTNNDPLLASKSSMTPGHHCFRTPLFPLSVKRAQGHMQDRPKGNVNEHNDKKKPENDISFSPEPPDHEVQLSLVVPDLTDRAAIADQEPLI